MPTRTEWTRLQLRSVFWDAAEANPLLSLYDALRQFARARFSEVKNGKVVSAASGNGQDVEFTLVEGGISPADCLSAASRLIDLYEESRAALVSSGVSSPTDSQILAEMLHRLQPVRSYRTDFRSVREEYACDEVPA